MRLSTILASSLVVVPAVAAAEVAATDLREPRTASHYEFVASQRTDTHISFARQLLPPTDPIAVLAQSRVIYLNRAGVTVSPGNNDSRTNRSTIVSSQSTIPAWNVSAATWAATVTCMKDMFARWDVTITDVNPGNVPHIEAVFGGSPQNVGMSSGVGGVSPFTENCGVIENSIVFTFTSVFGNNPQVVCEVMAQEVAHSYGLDHEMLASDPMTYLSYNGKRTFKDQTASCGEFSNRPCGIGGSVCRPSQNSVQLLNERLGAADLVAPILGITFPQDGAIVQPGFAVEATASDNVAVQMATLLIDDAPVGMVPGIGPFNFATDAALAEGAHTITVEATDGRNMQRQSITITVMKELPPGDTDGDGDVDADDDPVGDDGSITGGCSTTDDAGGGVLLFALLFARRRRRRSKA